jgi:hypothetical protein
MLIGWDRLARELTTDPTAQVSQDHGTTEISGGQRRRTSPQPLPTTRTSQANSIGTYLYEACTFQHLSVTTVVFELGGVQET